MLEEYEDEEIPEEPEPEEAEIISIGPQPGPQTMFLSSPADIAIFGGAAGGGKSYALLLDPLRHFENPRFGGTIFRKNSTQVRNQGGLWDESEALYTLVGAHPQASFLKWTFPSGASVKFAHLENDLAVFDYQGAQIPYIGFDELTHFSEKQFFYMMSRNRSTSGVPGYIRATCNPDPDSWVRKFIDWWIDARTGYPIIERSGVLRWFIRIDDKIIWADTAEELQKQYGDEQLPKSVTFIPSKITDNQILIAKDPSYLANLNALSRVDRARLKDGNWNVRESAGLLFKREWFRSIKTVPGGWVSQCRFWDRAATLPSSANPDPDWTRGLRLLRYPNGIFVIADLKSIRDTPHKVEDLIVNVASHDGPTCKIVSQIDPGSAGKTEAAHFTKMLIGYDVHVRTISKDKVTRAKPVSAQCEAGNVWVVEAPWNDELFGELEGFPEIGHDDIVDTLSGAFNELSGEASILDAL